MLGAPVCHVLLGALKSSNGLLWYRRYRKNVIIHCRSLFSRVSTLAYSRCSWEILSPSGRKSQIKLTNKYVQLLCFFVCNLVSIFKWLDLAAAAATPIWQHRKVNASLHGSALPAQRPIYKTYELQSLDSLKLGVVYPSIGPFPGLTWLGCKNISTERSFYCFAGFKMTSVKC